jgi:hypothetical protein
LCGGGAGGLHSSTAGGDGRSGAGTANGMK